MSAVEIVTKDDLLHFKQELLREVETLLIRYSQPETKRWLKTNEVRKLLGLSAGTLQTMRNNGTLSFSLIGNLAFYDYNEVIALLEKTKQNRLPQPLLKSRK